jgi:RNA-binding protein
MSSVLSYLFHDISVIRPFPIEFSEGSEYMKDLTGKQIRRLRGLGHHLKPVVMIGRDDVTEQVMAAVEENLTAKELIKIKIQEGCSLDRKDVAILIAERSGASVVQILGKTILLYRRSPENLLDIS